MSNLQHDLCISTFPRLSPTFIALVAHARAKHSESDNNLMSNLEEVLELCGVPLMTSGSTAPFLFHSFRDSPQPTVPFGLLIIPSHTTTTYQRHPPPPTPYVAVASAATEVERNRMHMQWWVERSRMRCGK